MGGSLEKSLFEMAGMLFLLVLLLLEMPKFAFAVVYASVTLMSL